VTVVHVRIEEHRLVVRDPASLDGVLGLRSWARTAAERGNMTGDEADRWENLYDQVVANGRFCWSVSFFISCGRKPALISTRRRAVFFLLISVTR